MQTTALKGSVQGSFRGYFENGNFYQDGRLVMLPERQMFLVEPLNIPVKPDDKEAIINANIEFYQEFDKLVAECDEEWNIDDFPRMDLGRELIIFDDDTVSR
jgi:hypothetical protein